MTKCKQDKSTRILKFKCDYFTTWQNRNTNLKIVWTPKSMCWIAIAFPFVPWSSRAVAGWCKELPSLRNSPYTVSWAAVPCLFPFPRDSYPEHQTSIRNNFTEREICWIQIYFESVTILSSTRLINFSSFMLVFIDNKQYV